MVFAPLVLAAAEVRSRDGAAIFSLLPCCCVPLALVLGVLGTAFWVWMLIDCIQHETEQDNQKVLWILVIVLGHTIGAAVYYFVRKRNRARF